MSLSRRTFLGGLSALIAAPAAAFGLKRDPFARRTQEMAYQIAKKTREFKRDATFKTYDVLGIREDLYDVIYSTSPEETPFFTHIHGNVSSVTHEWITDELKPKEG